MNEVIAFESFQDIAQMQAIIEEKFAQGVHRIDITRDSKPWCRMNSPEETRRLLARSIAEQLLLNPDALEKLDKSLKQTPEVW